LPTNTSTYITSDSTCKRDSLRTLACVDCFIRLKAIKQDKDSCIEDNKILYTDNTNKSIKIVDLTNENLETKHRFKIWRIVSVTIIGILTTSLILSN
jgi:hypothetical protein